MESKLGEAYRTVKELLERNREALDRLQEALLEKETLDGDDVRAIVDAHAARADLDRRSAESAAFL
jgi:cell division protease FtsH